MEAKDIEFGVELETTAPRGLVNIGCYHDPRQVSFLPQGWGASRDGSIDADAGFSPCEIVSPRLKGDDGIRQLLEVCTKLRERGFKVNSSCGVHVSVNWGRFEYNREMTKLVTMTSYLEKAIYASTGTHRRENGQWCKSVRQYGKVDEAMPTLKRDRYHLLNLTNFARGQERVEFRAFSPSLNATKIAGWIQLCLGIVEKSKADGRLPAWEAKSSPEQVAFFGGVGQREMYRLMLYLGWYESTQRRRGNDGHGWGIISQTISQHDIRCEINRLAKKYDAAC